MKGVICFTFINFPQNLTFWVVVIVAIGIYCRIISIIFMLHYSEYITYVE